MYCRSVANTSLVAIDRAADLDGLLGLMRTNCPVDVRYHKLNLTAFRKHKTVEFRQHSGTLDTEKARQWIALCLRMVEAATLGRTITPDGATQMNNARRGSKTHIVGEMMLRPEGVSNAEAIAATGWTAISLPAQAAACGLTVTRERVGGEVRYFARAAAATTTTPATLDGLLDHVGCDDAEREYFRARTTNLSGPVQWAA